MKKRAQADVAFHLTGWNSRYLLLTQVNWPKHLAYEYNAAEPVCGTTDQSPLISKGQWSKLPVLPEACGDTVTSAGL